MKATIDKDIVVRIGRGTVEIPNDYPRNVGFERLRWDGEKFVDLIKLNGFWVEYVNGAFVLHCKEFPNTYYVAMSYRDRKNLRLNGTAPRLKTEQELQDEKESAKVRDIQGELKSLLDKEQTTNELLAFLLGLIASLIVYVRTNSPTIETRLDDILDELQSLPLGRMTRNADNKLIKLKSILEIFYNKLDGV